MIIVFGGAVTNATVAALKWTVQRSAVQITIPTLSLHVSGESAVSLFMSGAVASRVCINNGLL